MAEQSSFEKTKTGGETHGAASDKWVHSAQHALSFLQTQLYKSISLRGGRWRIHSFCLCGCAKRFAVDWRCRVGNVLLFIAFVMQNVTSQSVGYLACLHFFLLFIPFYAFFFVVLFPAKTAHLAFYWLTQDTISASSSGTNCPDHQTSSFRFCLRQIWHSDGTIRVSSIDSVP